MEEKIEHISGIVLQKIGAWYWNRDLWISETSFAPPPPPPPPPPPTAVANVQTIRPLATCKFGLAPTERYNVSHTAHNNEGGKDGKDSPGSGVDVKYYIMMTSSNFPRYWSFNS